MLLTKPQQQRFWREWQAVIRHQSWQHKTPAELTSLRHQVLEEACHVTSLTEVDRAAGFDLLLAKLGQLQDKITPTIETDHPEHGERRRILWQIQQLTNELSEPYALSICKSRFGHTDLDDLSPQQLSQFRNTLNARLQSKRRKGRGHPVPSSPDQPF